MNTSALKFITGNKDKYEEVKTILGVELERLDLDLPEIQSLDPREIIKAKLIAAVQHDNGPFIVEDTSLNFRCLSGLPGPMVKWFEKALGIDGIYRLVAQMDDPSAEAKVWCGYYHDGLIEYFEGTVTGQVVEPIGTLDFGWGPLFRPDGSAKTYGQMTWEEKQVFSPRRLALEKLKIFLDSNKIES